MNAPATDTRTTERTIHSMNWVRATRATPMILPNIRSTAFTEEIRTSTTLLFFSSMTLDITCPPNITMNIQMMMPSSIETIMYIPDSLTDSLPSSPRVYSLIFTSERTSSMIFERLSMPYWRTRYSSTALSTLTARPEVNSTPRGLAEYADTLTDLETVSSGEMTTSTSLPIASRSALRESGSDSE